MCGRTSAPRFSNSELSQAGGRLRRNAFATPSNPGGHTMRTMTCALAVLTALFAALVLPSQAQERWPQRQVTIIVPFAAGGTADLFGRMLGAHLQAKFGQPFIVENRVGAAGNIGTSAAARAAPDGHTLLLGTTGGFAINPFLYTKMPHDTVSDFQPVSMIARCPTHFVVYYNMPATL